MGKIKWTKEEIERIVFHAAYELRNENNPNIFLQIKKSQKSVLPPERQRNLKSADKVKAVIEMVYTKLYELSEVKSKESTSETPIVPPNIEAMVENAVMKMLPSIMQGVKAAVEESLNKNYYDTVRSLATMFAEKQKESPVLVDNEPQKKPNVLVVGLLPNQENEVKKSFDSKINLRFVNSCGQNLHHLQDMAKYVDHIIVDTKFVSHSHTECLKGLKNVIMAHGGLSKIRSTLMGLI